MGFTPNYFILHNRDQVITFEELLNNYTKEKIGFSINHVSLIDAFDKLQRHENGGKIFTSLLDIQINNILLQCDIEHIVNIWNKLSREQRNEGSILDSENNFFDKMDIHRFSTSFIFRYRALWDKIMGLHVLILSPSNYDAFCKSKSKRKSFRNIMSKIHLFPTKIIDEIEQIVTDFNNKFRTSEAHGTGKLRKLTFLMEPFHKNEQVLFIDFWNVMNRMIISIGDMIRIMPKY